LLFSAAASLAEDTSPYYSVPSHKVFEKFLGDWDVIYANRTDKGVPSGGRGEAKAELDLGKTVLKINSKLGFDLGEINLYSIIGYDKNFAKYYFISYDNSGETPALFWGEYISEGNLFEFKTYDKYPSEGDIRLEVKLERKDKFTVKSYIRTNGVDKVSTDMAYIK
ncbi:MAG: hypothetical protein RIF34_09025, partial [Candidatus Kapaibacterium sp.]